jgi:hypothetical protein
VSVVIGDLLATIAHAFRRVRLPLAAYYAVTVAIPLANGANRAAQSGATFWQHTLAVLLVPPIIVVAVCVAYRIAASASLTTVSRRR